MFFLIKIARKITAFNKIYMYKTILWNFIISNKSR